jgi:glycosyltransferase involved in cell wall biosynthesis
MNTAPQRRARDIPDQPRPDTSAGRMTVSVVVPTFNSARTVGHCLDSILRQTVTPDEIIVIDDGSIDDTTTIVPRYFDHVTVLTQSHMGAAAARNRGVLAATGDFVAFLDSDDLWHPQKLELQLGAFRSYPDAALCCTEFERVTDDASERWLASFDRLTSAITTEVLDDFGDILAAPYLGTSTVLMKRSRFLASGGFDESLNTAEDADLWLRTTYGSTALKLRHRLCRVLVRADSLCGSVGCEAHRDLLGVIRRFCAAHPEVPARFATQLQAAEAQVLERLGSESLTVGDNLVALRALASSLRRKASTRRVLLFLKAAVGCGLGLARRRSR